MSEVQDSLFDKAYQILSEISPEQKCLLSQQTLKQWRGNQLSLVGNSEPVSIPLVGRPEKPELIAPKRLKKRAMHTLEGRVALMHAIAHIEFNAINLAWDAVYRFRGMPRDYYDDWLQVACDEARHYLLVCQYLQQYNTQYGDLPAHNGLWDMALRTEHDVMVRMALVPRVMEARGLDVTPRMIESLKLVGDEDAASILSVIYQEEILHVDIGSRWFQYCCLQNNVDSRKMFEDLVGEYFYGRLRGPYNLEARLQAGFDREELVALFGEPD